MLRIPFLPRLAALTLASLCGCFGSVETDTDCDPQLTSPEADIGGLQERYALGSRTEVRLLGDQPVSFESSDPGIVRVDRVARGKATLSFVGEGQASVTARNEVSSTTRYLEVLPHATFVVLLTEVTSVPLGPLAGQLLLGGPQYVLVMYLDSDARKLYGDGLAEVTFSSGLRRCGEDPGALDSHCLTADHAGEHVVNVRVGEQELSFEYETVREEDIVGIEVLQANESELLAASWAQIDVVGVTGDGRRVSSVHPQFRTEDGLYIGYFAYEYRPEAKARALEISALNERKITRFRGVPSEKTAFGCKSERDSGPIPAAASLLGMVAFIRLGSRRGRDF